MKRRTSWSVFGKSRELNRTPSKNTYKRKARVLPVANRPNALCENTRLIFSDPRATLCVAATRNQSKAKMSLLRKRRTASVTELEKEPFLKSCAKKRTELQVHFTKQKFAVSSKPQPLERINNVSHSQMPNDGSRTYVPVNQPDNVLIKKRIVSQKCATTSCVRRDTTHPRRKRGSRV